MAEELASGPEGPDPALCSVGLGKALPFPGSVPTDQRDRAAISRADLAEAWKRGAGAHAAARAGEDGGRGEERGQGPDPSPTATIAGIR